VEPPSFWSSALHAIEEGMMALLQQTTMEPLAMAAKIKDSPATAMDSKLERCLGQGSPVGEVQRPAHLGIRRVAKLADRVAARVGRSGMASVFIR
jgi:hypothetical protein